MKSQVVAFCFLLLTALTATADDAEPVADLGPAPRLEIHGAKTFSVDEIREALFNEFEVVAACEKNAPRAALVSLVSEKLTAGYKAAGFPNAKVTVVAANGIITAAIEEGDRYPAAEPIVTGDDRLDAVQFKDKLTRSGSSGSKRAIWQVGEPAPFNSEHALSLEPKVADLLAELGYYRPELTIAIEPDQQTKTGVLKVDIRETGPRTSLSDIEIAGAERDSPEALMAYLGLDGQTSLTGDVRRQVVEQLLGSGRFTQVQWKIGQSGQRDEAWRPQLSLREYEQAPPIDDGITREEAALLQLAKWVERFDESDEELLLRFTDQNVSVVFAPRHGFIITLEPPAPTGVEKNGPAAITNAGFVSAVVMAEERVGLYSSAQRKKLDAAPPPGPIMGNAQITLVAGSPNWDGRGRLAVGAGVRHVAPHAHRRHVKMQLTLTAAAALSVVRTHEARSRWEGDVVTFEWKNRKMRVNSLTGRLLEQVIMEAPSSQELAVGEDAGTPHITLTSGQFQRRLAEIEKATADWPNLADGKRPLSCVGQFVCDELQRFDATSKDGYAAVGKLLAAGVFQPFDELVCQACRPAAATFAIPQPDFQFQFHSIETLFSSQNNGLARALGMRIGNHLFPRNGWLNGLWREGVFLLADGRTEASDDLSCQPTTDRGAVCALAAAEILNAVGCDTLSPACARRGLRRLSLPAFHDDYRELLSGDGVASQCLLHTADALRQLSSAETKSIAALLSRFELLDAAKCATFEHFMAQLRTAKGDAPAQAVATALDALWRGGLSDWIEHRLKALAEPAPAREGAAGYVAATPPPVLDRYGRPIAGTVQEQPSYGLPQLPGENGNSDGEPPATPNAGGAVEREDVKPLKDEVREAKWLAQALAERLKALEERLQAEAGEVGSHLDATLSGDATDSTFLGDLPGSITTGNTIGGGPAAVKQDMAQIYFSGPKGMVLQWDISEPGKFDSEPLSVPGRYNFPCGAIYRLKLTDIPKHKGAELYPLLELAPLLQRSEKHLNTNAVPIGFTDADFDEVFAGRFVTKVIYLPDTEPGGEPLQGVETLCSSLLEPVLDPIGEADRRGTVLAIIRLGAAPMQSDGATKQDK